MAVKKLPFTKYFKDGKVAYEFGFNGTHHYLLRNDEDYAGLWFGSNRSLEDYDGVCELSQFAIQTIREAGFKVSDDF